MMSKTNNILKKQLKKIERLVLRMILVYGTVAGLGFIIPFGFLPKAGRRFRGNFRETLPSQIGITNYLIIMILICLVISGIILYLNKYFDLKKDMVEERTLKLFATVQQTKYVNSDFGEGQIQIKLRPNKYSLEKVRIAADAKDIDMVKEGQELELELSANAYFPLDFRILSKENPIVSKERMDQLLEAIQKVKNKN